MDAIALALKEMYDLYGLCAGRHFELVDWLDNPDHPGRPHHPAPQP
ncbi:MAG: hypothetical protein QM617_04930 [Comamonas sp.]